MGNASFLKAWQFFFENRDDHPLRMRGGLRGGRAYNLRGVNRVRYSRKEKVGKRQEGFG